MSSLVDTTNENKPLTYTQKLCLEFTDSMQVTFTAEEISQIIISFQKTESDKKKHVSDILTFGKYRFKSVKDVILFDRKYCEWLLKQELLSNYPELKQLLTESLK